MADGTENFSPKLLVVDDAPEIGFIVQRLGRRCGYQVVSCPDVPTAWEHLLLQRPDLLIVDVNLPGESGLVLCQRVRETPELARLPMALFSHWERPGDIAAGLEAGSDYVVSKSALSRPEDWQQRVFEVLSYPNSRFCAPSLDLTTGLSPEAIHLWGEGVNQLLRFQVQRQLGTEVTAILLRRAVERMGAGFVPPALLPGELGIAFGRTPTRHDREMILAFAVALANELWCILGSIEGAALFRALAAAVPPLAETFTLK